MRILLQRLEDETSGRDVGGRRVGAHLDLACDDVDAEVGRHESLGAIEQYRTSGWVTLSDPTGLAYGITGRRPDWSPHVRR